MSNCTTAISRLNSETTFPIFFDRFGQLSGRMHHNICKKRDVFFIGKNIAPAPIENKLSHPQLEVSCVTGSDHPQPFILLMMSLDGRQALDKGELNRDVLTNEFDQLLKQVNSSVEDHERLSCVVIVKDQWMMENGFLTPTKKIKRNVIEARYLQLFDAWLKLGKKVVWEA